jgi:AcrR family transcriptional regulator
MMLATIHSSRYTIRSVRGRPLSFDRDRALDQALLLFWEHGYETTSVAELIGAMGISPPSLYAAFGDKRRLFLEATDRYQTTYAAYAARAVTEEPTAYTAIARLLRESAREFTKPRRPRGCLVLSAASNCTPAADEICDDLRRRRKATLHSLERVVRRDATAGLLPAETDLHGLAVFFVATLQGMSQQARDGATRLDLLAVAEISLRAWPSPNPLTRHSGPAGGDQDA